MKKKLIAATAVFFLASLFIIYPAYAYRIKGIEKEVFSQDVKINGREYVLLTDVCEADGIEWEWDSISRRIILHKNGREVVLLVGSRLYFANDRVKEINAPLLIRNGSVYMPLGFAKDKLGRLFYLEKRPGALRAKAPAETEPIEAKKPVSISKKYEMRKIVIDPGHGGKDPGAVSRTGFYEKNIVLDVSKRIKEELENNGIDVIMTRDLDEFITLGNRITAANENNADLFVSIHANSNKRRWIRGFEVYYLSEATDDNARALAASENSVLQYEESSFAKHTRDLDAIVWDLKFTENREESIELAGFICQEVSRQLNMSDSRVRSAKFYVIKGAKMPAVLVELSYLSNKLDERNLRKSDYRQKLAGGIAGGILAYKTEYERTNGFSR